MYPEHYCYCTYQKKIDHDAVYGYDEDQAGGGVGFEADPAGNATFDRKKSGNVDRPVC